MGMVVLSNERLVLSNRIGGCMKCLLKIFGILTINEIVPYREHPNPKFAYVYYGKGWHTVPIEDIKIFHLCGCNMARSGNKATEI